MFASGSAVELIDPDLLPAQVIWVSGVVFNVKPEISRALLRFLHRCETGGNRERDSR